MNLIEKILARASGRRELEPGEIVLADVDLMLMHDLSAHFVSRVFRDELGDPKIPYPERVAIVFDHAADGIIRPDASGRARLRKVAQHREPLRLGSGSLHHVILEAGSGRRAGHRGL